MLLLLSFFESVSMIIVELLLNLFMVGFESVVE
ncbi:unnamed protein product [Schistosoma mattheei]|uniref:Uncharacterized protein n=1 Tax=Schistosoma mattheei TaxID=31246 RepID=A0A3P8GRS5_9TREM|nr:unnamed protein product [Schistosoma mattheei]